MNRKTLAIGIGVVAVAVIAAIALLGSGDDSSGSSSAGTDSAFVADMVPHHQSAIEMAQIAQDRAQHPEIKELAANIIESQSGEIETMDSINERLLGGPVEATDGGTLGLSMDSMGMTMDTSSLETAKPFDQAFIDMMVPHHQGAIEMARIEFADGSDPESQSLAEDIIAAQTREIEEMNAWRTEWYGAPSPAGGVPAE